MWDVGLICMSVRRSCLLTDFSWTTPLDFLDIMLGLPERSQLCSVIFEVRTVIFGQNDLCPYAGRGFYFLWILKTLTIEHSDGQSRFHPARLQCWSEPSGRLPDGLGGPQMAQTQRILCCDNIRDHSGLHFDRFFMDHPLRFSRYNVRAAGAESALLGHF